MRIIKKGKDERRKEEMRERERERWKP